VLHAKILFTSCTQDIYTDQFLNNGSPLYNIGGYVKIRGPFNKEIFQEVVNTAPEVFDVFKMRFDLNDADPCFFLDHGYEKPAMNELDLSDFSNPEQEAKRWMKDRFNTAFKLSLENPPFEHFL
jgi:hypothetical protein